MRGAGIMVIRYTVEGLGRAGGKPLPEGSHFRTYTTAARLVWIKANTTTAFPEAELWLLLLRSGLAWKACQE